MHFWKDVPLKKHKKNNLWYYQNSSGSSLLIPRWMVAIRPEDAKKQVFQQRRKAEDRPLSSWKFTYQARKLQNQQPLLPQKIASKDKSN